MRNQQFPPCMEITPAVWRNTFVSLWLLLVGSNSVISCKMESCSWKVVASCKRLINCEITASPGNLLSRKSHSSTVCNTPPSFAYVCPQRNYGRKVMSRKTDYQISSHMLSRDEWHWFLMRTEETKEIHLFWYTEKWVLNGRTEIIWMVSFINK